MMEVTKANFPDIVLELPSLLSRCSLVSFDCEFTGLRAGGIREDWEDTPDERYGKLRKCSSDFTLIQFGICFFVQDSTADLKYEVFPFNFYLFPSYSLGRRVPQRLDRCFRCQPSSLLMLATSGLDFNKWIMEGVPYMRESDEVWWRGRRREEGEPSQDELNKFLGFSQIFKMIVESRVPLVGHSILLDLLHSYSHFIDDLPEALRTFKMEIHEQLPCLYDTQLMCEDETVRPHLGTSLSLANVYSSLIQSNVSKVTTVLPGSCAHYASGKHLHEAAYDAYISGYVFVEMARMIGGVDTTDLFEALDDYKNRIYLFNCESADALCLTGPETRALRDHIFHLTFPKEMITDDIKNLFSPFGGCRVSWINDTSARVSLHHRGRAKEAFKALTGERSMCEKPFVIRQLDSIPISQSALQHGAPAELPATSPGKRKMQDEDVHQSHENTPPSPKRQMFEENTDW